MMMVEIFLMMKILVIDKRFAEDGAVEFIFASPVILRSGWLL